MHAYRLYFYFTEKRRLRFHHELRIWQVDLIFVFVPPTREGLFTYLLHGAESFLRS